jgi:hypothetical protein
MQFERSAMGRAWNFFFFLVWISWPCSKFRSFLVVFSVCAYLLGLCVWLVFHLGCKVWVAWIWAVARVPLHQFTNDISFGQNGARVLLKGQRVGKWSSCSPLQ